MSGTSLPATCVNVPSDSPPKTILLTIMRLVNSKHGFGINEYHGASKGLAMDGFPALNT
jgi:hypothetical protein